MTAAEPDFDVLLRQALAASAANDSMRAIALLRQASALDPTRGMPLFLLGAEYAAMQDYRQAEIAFADAVALAPELVIARYQLGLLQFSSGRVDVALSTWRALLALPEPNPFAGFIHGFEALARGEGASAIQLFEAGLASNAMPRMYPEALLGSGLATPDVISRGLANAIGNDIRVILDTLTAGETSGDTGPVLSTQPASHVLLSNYHPAGKPN
jgi:tetratricopeptide (TPR) repeat protein